MQPFIIILIVLFAMLILYQLSERYFSTTIIEGNTGNTGNSDSSSQAMILAQQNTGNLNSLKQQFNDSGANNLKSVLHDMSGNIADLQTQINEISKANSDTATNIAGNKPHTISGTDTS
jgi:hypothetical protein